jgi:catechol 2,3-dioxygenase-like lactoylglutathione lyase family enzyme
MTPRIDIITLGVNDVQQARDFYGGAFGATVSGEAGALQVHLGATASRLDLCDWDEAAQEAGVAAQSRGFRAFTLSFIVESADDVDRVLTRAERHGGVVSKPPKNAVWGYSAYLTDPDGYLWKIASSKRRPLLGRKPSAADNGQPVHPQEVPLTIGVADMRLAKAFYEDGIGLPVKKAYGTKFVMFGGDGETSDMGMYKREALADDAAVGPDGHGFHGFSITHAVESAERVEELLARAERSGGQILVRPDASSPGGHAGAFADLDGNVWRIAANMAA